MTETRAKNESWQKGVVHWFDATSGEGVIKGANGQSYFVHYSAIESSKKWKTLEDKKQVKFKLVKDSTFSQVSHVKEI